MSEAPRFYSNRDMGDETHDGAEIMRRLQEQELQRQAELAQMDDTFDDSPVNNYPDELNNRERK